MIKEFFYKFKENIIAIFSGWNTLWHLGAILLTYILVQTGFDWFWFLHTRSPFLFAFLIPAALLGFFVPIFTPLVLLWIGTRRKNFGLKDLAYALAQSAAIAWLISAAYKAITGRLHPVTFRETASALTDISHVFRFGFFRGGIFWGWPSSHTMVAFAIAATAIMLIPNAKMKIGAVAFAFYIGIGVSLTIHWFSDFAAGAILGTLAGIVVGRAFQRKKTM